MASVAEIATLKERPNIGIPLSRDDHQVLAGWSRSRTLPARVVLRSRIVLMLGTNRSATVVAAALRVAPATVRLWRARFLEYGPGGLLKDAPGRGRKPALDLETREALRSGVGVLSVRRRARELGVSPATVSRWRRRGE